MTNKTRLELRALAIAITVLAALILAASGVGTQWVDGVARLFLVALIVMSGAAAIAGALTAAWLGDRC